MSKYYFHLDESSYKLLQKHLEKYSIDIDGMPVKNFLIANSTIEDTSNPLHIRIRNIILHIAGDFDSKPGDLPDEVNLEFSLKFRNTEYLLLQKQLSQLTKSFDKAMTIGIKEVHKCLTVGDCIDLVHSKLEQNQ